LRIVAVGEQPTPNGQDEVVAGATADQDLAYGRHGPIMAAARDVQAVGVAA